MNVETLYLDAGGVLVNPNFARVADVLRSHGVAADGSALADFARALERADCRGWRRFWNLSTGGSERILTSKSPDIMMRA